MCFRQSGSSRIQHEATSVEESGEQWITRAVVTAPGRIVALTGAESFGATTGILPLWQRFEAVSCACALYSQVGRGSVV